MRKIYLFLFMPFVWASMAGCYEDNSSLGTKTIPDIAIAEFRDTAMVSYSGKVLEVTPEVTTDYPESSLSYAWYCYPDKAAGMDDTWENGYKNNLISEERNLSYEVNLPTGTYYFIFEVTSKENHYARTQKFKLNTTTEFAGCFYVLKETKDGNSELDLVNGNELNPDVITKVNGTPLAGKPVNLSYIYNQGYIDEEAGGSAGARAMYVFTEEDCRVYNTDDMKEILNRNTLNYDPLKQGEMPRSAYCSFVLMMLSNEGFYYTQPYDPDMGYTNAGKYGLSIGAGGSPWVVSMGGMYSAFWSESAHHIYMTDYNGTSPSALDYEMPASVEEKDLECIGGGQNYVAGVETNWFLVEHKPTGERYLLLLDGFQEVYEIRKLASSLHMAKADIVATCGMSAPVIYVIDENTLWRYHFEDGTETQLVLPGIGEGETLSYVSNQYLNAASCWGDTSYDFDNLIVGTQKGETYRLYIYDDVVGGVPQKAVEPVLGTGKVKSVRFAAPISFGIFSYIMVYGGPIFPLCD